MSGKKCARGIVFKRAKVESEIKKKAREDVHNAETFWEELWQNDEEFKKEFYKLLTKHVRSRNAEPAERAALAEDVVQRVAEEFMQFSLGDDNFGNSEVWPDISADLIDSIAMEREKAAEEQKTPAEKIEE